MIFGATMNGAFTKMNIGLCELSKIEIMVGKQSHTFLVVENA